jgi:hypothetical protein
MTQPIEGATMKVTVVRAIPIVLVAAIVELLVSGVPRFENAKHGIDYVVGEIAWLGFLAAALALIGLVAVAAARVIARRRATITMLCLALGALALCTAALAGRSTARSPQAFSLRLDGKHLGIASTVWRAGAVQIAATATRGEQELSLLRFRPGYSYAGMLADGRRADGHGKAAAAALARIMRGTEFAGGVDVFPGEHASFTALVRPGTYYLGELNDRPIFRVIHVTGAPDGALGPSAATVREYDFGYRVHGSLPAHGTITIRNVGRQPHRLNLEPVRPGTTRAAVGAYLRKTGGRPYGPPPGFSRRGPELGTALVGPGETMQFSYSVPAGTYALIGWQQDSKTGKPQALEGMYAVASFR